jgi:hypothetical protein
LRKAVSAAYYALFHCLAGTAADLFVGKDPAERHQDAWRTVYRALDHGTASTACRTKDILMRLPTDIFDLADQFVLMQTKRTLADYDPLERFDAVAVAQMIGDTEKAIGRFDDASESDKRAFVAHILFRRRAAR